MNKKLSSLFISFILLISGLMIFNIESVSAVQGWAVNITSKTSTTPYFNNNSIPVLFDVKVTIIDVPQNANVSRIKITAPQNYVLDLKGSQPSPPSGWSINYSESNASGTHPHRTMAYDKSDGFYGTSNTVTFTVRINQASGNPPPPGGTWTITPYRLDGNVHSLSKTTSITFIDPSPPKFDIKYIKTPKVENINSEDILNAGIVTIRLEANESVSINSAQKPIVQVKQNNQADWKSVTVSPQSGSYPDSVFIGTYDIVTSSGGFYDGTAQVTVSAPDRAGNIGTIITGPNPTSDGPSFIVDTQCNTPGLVSPLNGFSSSAGSISFKWQKITDVSNNPITYIVQFSTSSNFTSNVITASADCNESKSTPEFLGVNTTIWQISGDERIYTATALSQGTWYWRVYATDALGNQSSFSQTRSFILSSSDTKPPNFRIRYIKTPKIDYISTPDVVGSGSMQLKVYSSEALQSPPTVQIKPHNTTTWTSVSMSQSGSSSVFVGTYNVPSDTYINGLALVTVQGRDLAGNFGSDINASDWNASRKTKSPYLATELDSDGPSFYIDTACDSPSLYQPSNGYTIPDNKNEANFTFYRISDLSSERAANVGQNNCITYNIQYSTSPNFSTNVITQSVDINESKPSPVFCATGNNSPYNNWYIIDSNLRKHKSQSLSNGTWYWRVWATDKLGNQSPYSETRSFSVSTVAPKLYSPTDLSLIRDSNVSLKWYNVSSADSYNIRLSRGDTNFLDYTLYPDKIAVNRFLEANDASADIPFITDYNVSISEPPTPAIGRLEDGVWYWKVASNLDVTSYSETWRFTIDTTGPPAPNLLTLTEGQVSQNKRPTFTWTAVSDTNDLSNPVRYYIQISGNPTFPGAPGPANVSFSGTTAWPSPTSYATWKLTTYQRGPLTTPNFVPSQDFPETLLTDPGAAYYWRVYAVDSAGNRGTNSITRVFRVSTSPLILWGDLPAGKDEICDPNWPTGCRTGNDVNRDQLALALRSPSNGFTLNSNNPQLEWRHSRCDCVVKEISSYIIQYSKDITFPPDKTTDVSGIFQVLGINPDNNLFVNMGYTIQTPLYNGTYFWRVCAVDTAGNRTQFTAPWSFTVNVPDNEQPPQCSATQPCPSGYTCQSGVCVPVVMAPGDLTITVQSTAGTAISGATVTVDGTAKTTDAEGKVTFAALSGGSHTINNVTASGYNDHGTSTVTVNGATAQTITMTTPGTEGYVWGTVYFDQIGSPAPNILIDIFNQSTDVKIDSRLTNSEGKFQSSPLPSTGTYYIKIPAYEKELRDLQPTSLTTGEKIVILETKGTITGIVQDDAGQIVSSATVVLKKYPGEEFVDTKTTNSIGQFSFDALPGTYVVTISKAGYDAYTSSSFSVQSRQTVNLQTVLGNIILNSIRGTLTVSVKDDKGAVVNTATVTVRSSTGVVAKSFTTSGGTGSAQLAPGSYRVSAVASGFAESLQQTTNINSNQTSSLTITLAPATGSIRVVAKDPSGAPLSGASVYIDGALAGITDSNGELLATGLKLGTHTVRITKGGFTTVEEQVTAGETAVVVDTSLKKNNLVLFLAIGLGLLILAGALYFFKFGKKGTGPKGRPAPKGLSLPQRPGAPRLRPHRHKGGLPPSSIKVKKKNL